MTDTDGATGPAWQAAYDSATFTPRLIADRITLADAQAAAETWLRTHCDAGDLVWTPDPGLTDDQWRECWTLVEVAPDGTVLATDVVVRHPATEAGR